MSDFEIINATALSELKGNRSKGNQMKPANRKILDGFEKASDGQGFLAPVPDKEDANKYAKRVSNFLTTQGHKNRTVFANPNNPKQIVVERTAEEAA